MPIKIFVIIIFRNLYLYKFLSLLFSLTYTYTNFWVLHLGSLVQFPYGLGDGIQKAHSGNGLPLGIYRGERFEGDRE